MFKRLFIGVNARLDQAMSAIENHEAIVEAAIDDAREALARLKVERGGVAARRDRLVDQQRVLRDESERWQRRASELMSAECADEERALGCLQERERCAVSLQELEQRLCDDNDLIALFDERCNALAERLAEAESKRDALRSRDLAAQGDCALDAIVANDPQGHLQNGFKRWETGVVERELRRDAAHTGRDRLTTRGGDSSREPSGRSLDQQFRARESEQRLREELARMRAQAGSDSQPASGEGA